ncbi:hypothetical protein QJS10_CPA01g00780 [Acorus calamus]|uniref:Myb-like domain-containing protein n=1 Tax=Acorus calamus TaxID=4465 RepID=A0AAV9FG47_ACOCL|nr:hypothetical protein QJS10_CPA01g00780 [Acorus calamus]
MADDQSHAMVVVDEESKRREYRRGNWTPQETMTLMEAKKMDNERRLRRGGGGGGGGGEGSSSSGQSRPSELRWKWVEDYCWRLGCLRSQNQCNDKWDNLMRDYKKVRDYESRLLGSDDSSYWKLERHERKERGLPSNMLGQIYEAMAEIVERKGSSSVGASTAAAAAPLVHSDSDGSQNSGSPPLQPKKRRRREDEGTSNTTTTTNNTNSELATAITKGASVLADALLANEEREEEWHKSLLTLEERRLKIEETKADLTKQAMDGLIDSINKLANSILAVASSGKTSPRNQ